MLQVCYSVRSRKCQTIGCKYTKKVNIDPLLTFYRSHYLLGKCLWKMYTKVNDEFDEQAKRTRPTMATVINAFVKAIETVPKPRDSRSEPILEPHYKLMSIAHKLVIRGDIEPQ